MARRSRPVRTTQILSWHTTARVPRIDLTPAIDWPETMDEIGDDLRALALQVTNSLRHYSLAFVHDLRALSPEMGDSARNAVETGRTVCQLLELELGLSSGTLTDGMEHALHHFSSGEVSADSTQTPCSEGVVIHRRDADPGLLVIGAELFSAGGADSPEPASGLVVWMNKDVYRVEIPPGYALIRAGEELVRKTDGRVTACRRALVATPSLFAHHKLAAQSGGTLTRVASPVLLRGPLSRRSEPRKRPAA